MTTKGFVSLVGSGPGDPELMTLKALRLIQHADVVVYDRLVSPEIMAWVPHGVSQISVGKSPGKHCVPQDQINEILVSLASAGRRVVRLKGGDPYIFGRGGEEALVLRQHGIPFEVVPGVTAAAGCSSYSGIPLTHRGLNHGVRFVTGHLQNDESLNVDWEKLADPDCTLVIYMGLANLQQICGELIRAGMPSWRHHALPAKSHSYPFRADFCSRQRGPEVPGYHHCRRSCFPERRARLVRFEQPCQRGGHFL
jgi:uroporphyrin-III C-methyltransferase/precorrin-2 dehydrogenase/sirohydrochlorin ferrochelatase/uroporphyrin-III C-methyltransferase